ncbi:MAG: glucose-6-phosphate dehydrogenase, partial [Halanaerobiales bacterium]
IKLFIDNLRWQGVPFYIKTGKRLTHKSTEIIVEFKSGIHSFYSSHELDSNILVIRIQPLEGVFFQFNSKQPGTENIVVPVKMDFCQNCQLESNSPAAYERLLLDIIKNDSTLFTRWDEVEYAWEFIDRIKNSWSSIQPEFPNYRAGSGGPAAADRLIKGDDRNWWQINKLNMEQMTKNK